MKRIVSVVVVICLMLAVGLFASIAASTIASNNYTKVNTVPVPSVAETPLSYGNSAPSYSTVYGAGSPGNVSAGRNSGTQGNVYYGNSGGYTGYDDGGANYAAGYTQRSCGNREGNGYAGNALSDGSKSDGERRASNYRNYGYINVNRSSVTYDYSSVNGYQNNANSDANRNCGNGYVNNNTYRDCDNTNRSCGDGNANRNCGDGSVNRSCGDGYTNRNCGNGYNGSNNNRNCGNGNTYQSCDNGYSGYYYNNGDYYYSNTYRSCGNGYNNGYYSNGYYNNGYYNNYGNCGDGYYGNITYNNGDWSLSAGYNDGRCDREGRHARQRRMREIGSLNYKPDVTQQILDNWNSDGNKNVYSPTNVTDDYRNKGTNGPNAKNKPKGKAKGK